MKVLITYGGTKEPIDTVRYIGNMSTGKTGENIASYFIQQGAELTCIKAKDIKNLSNAKNSISYFSFTDLESALLESLNQEAYDVIIHAAAVSDYKVAKVVASTDESIAVGGKLRSGQKLQLILEPTPKLIHKIKDISKNQNALLVGFKLTESASPQERLDAVYKIFESGANLVVQNDLNDITGDKHICKIYSSPQNSVQTNTKQELAETLFRLIKERL